MKPISLNSLFFCSALGLGISTAQAQFTDIGDAYNFAVVWNGPNNGQVNNIEGPVTGSVAIGGSQAQQLSLAGGSISGNLDFQGTPNQNNYNQTTQSYSFGGPVSGSVVVANSAMASEISTITTQISSLSTAFGGYTVGSGQATALTINPGNGATQILNASTGVSEATPYGTANVFDISSLTLNPGETLKINGNGSGSELVVLNLVNGNGEFNGNITLSGGLTAEDVIINIVGGEFQNSSGTQDVTYVMNNVTGGINIESTVNGPVYAGGSGSFAITSGGSVNFVAPVPEPATWFAGAFVLIPIGHAVLKMIRRRSQKPAIDLV